MQLLLQKHPLGIRIAILNGQELKRPEPFRAQSPDRKQTASIMSAQKSGRQSPPPEAQSGKQQQDPPAQGQGVGDPSASNKAASEKTLQNLTSNPTGPLNQHAGDVVSKTVENTKP